MRKVTVGDDGRAVRFFKKEVSELAEESDCFFDEDMAYSCVRVQFEIGHEASIRNKRTPDGFTHDWEVFVRGADNAEIHHFVDKVVFHLHETFPRPKRIFKEPPYLVKESGYAGFNLPIDIYMKTKEEGSRKIRFFYDLTLQPLGSGAARISNVVKEKSDFLNPAEDFRRKLIRGGGVGVGSDGSTTLDKNPSNSTNSVVSSNNLEDNKNSPYSTGGKGKGGGGGGGGSGTLGGEPPSKKHKAPKEVKTEETRLTNSFAELFGTPIKTIKQSPGAGKPSKSDNKSHEKSGSSRETATKPPKVSPAKEKNSEKEKKDRDVGEKSGSKDKERANKEKESHKNEGEKSKEKTKKTGLFVLKDFIKKDDDRGKKEDTKEKEKPKIERKHEEKKNREDKEKKDKHKRDNSEKKETKDGGIEKDKLSDKKHESNKDGKERSESGSSKHKTDKDEKKSKASEKLKEKFVETEKTKHKHKKKDKHRKEEEREKWKKKEKETTAVLAGATGNAVQEAFKSSKPPQLTAVKEKVTPPCSPTLPPVAPVAAKPTTNPLNQLIAELSDKDSDSEFSGSEDVLKLERVAQALSPPPPSPPVLPPVPRIKEDKKLDVTPPVAAVVAVKEERPEKTKKKEKKSKDEEHKKRKRKHKDRDIPREEPIEKNSKASVTLMPVPELVIKEEKMSPERYSIDERSRSLSPDDTPFTDEYISQLKALQQRIMTLQDNADLQKVVQVISETGQFEITQRTFDFDLCALDPSTVKMLQEMFIPV